MADLQEAMTQLFRTTHGSEAETEDQEEMGLFVSDDKCYRCGKKGHKAYQCRKKGGKQRQGG
eukprot:1100852-Ditylum_brightwellii.AAC.1